MPKNVTVLDTERRVFSNLKGIVFYPWTNESTPSETGYDLVNIVADSTTVEQAENTVNAIDHEFSSEPLYENIDLGEKSFTCECIDLQNDVLKNLFGWKTTDGGDAFAPISYKPLYCTIEMSFNSTEDIVVLPKVKMNSRAVFSSMKTNASKGTLSGTCYSAYVKAGSSTEETDEAVVAAANKGTYTVSTSAS